MTVEANPIVTFSPAALAKVRALMAAEGAGLRLRVYVEGGGCSGLQYGFRFEAETADDDFALEFDGVTILVDAVSSQYLIGASVDFIEDLDGERFHIDNPNATTTCGCNSSFSA
jgi:iron-sulfur cluster insertion protein